MTEEDICKFKIIKVKASNRRPVKSLFILPEANRFFAKIKRDKGIISLVQPQEQEQTKHYQSSVVMSRSISLPLSHKLSIKRQELEPINQSLSALQIYKKTKPKQPIQIIKSELGCYNYYDILSKKQQMQNVLKNKVQSHETRMTSFASNDDMNEFQNSRLQLQKPYEQYDKILMAKEEIFKPKYFRLKHKADWSKAK